MRLNAGCSRCHLAGRRVERLPREYNVIDAFTADPTLSRCAHSTNPAHSTHSTHPAHPDPAYSTNSTTTSHRTPPASSPFAAARRCVQAGVVESVEQTAGAAAAGASGKASAPLPHAAAHTLPRTAPVRSFPFLTY